MAIHAIADLHLSFDERVDKPMDIYGARWQNHAERLKENWEANITEEDFVIVAGDISWALRPDEAIADLDWVHGLPGHKILLKGNHELWWQSIGKLNKLYDDMYFLQNTFFDAGGVAVCGSRGWICPGAEDFCERDEKIYGRELLRLEMSLEAAKKAGFTDIIGAMHFPPTNDKHQPSGFTQLFERYGVKEVVYGHLHGSEVWKKGMQSVLNGVSYRLVSLDYLSATPIRLR